MKNFFTTISFLVFSIVLAQGQVTIWGGPDDPNGSFDGGLNDWTAISAESSNPDFPDSVFWAWSADGTMQGTLAPAGSIESLTPDNGAAVFDSDFLDTRGNGFDANGNIDWSQFGTGQGPCTFPPGTDINTDQSARIGHRGELISPKIDCSANATVQLRFNQRYRGLVDAAGLDDFTFVDVSSDDGVTWTSFPINADIAVNDATAANDVQVLDITSAAAGSADVRLRFVFDGYFYYWMIDDVWLTELANDDLAMTGYAFYPASSKLQPQCSAEIDTMGFFAAVVNNGAVAAVNTELKVEIFNELAELIYSDSASRASVDPGVTDTITLDGSFIPAGIDLGQYIIRYSTSADNHDDFNESDNELFQEFFVTEDMFSKHRGGATTGLRPGAGGDYDLGNYFFLGPDCNQNFFLESINFECAVNAVDLPLAGKKVDFYVYEILDNAGPGFDDFDLTEDAKNFTHPNIEVVGFGEYEFTATDVGFQEITVTSIVETQNFSDCVLIEAGKRYFVMASYVGANNVLFQGVDNNQEDYLGISTVLYSDGWFLGGFGAEDAAVLDMNLAVGTAGMPCTEVTSAEEPELPAGSLSVYPNPTSNLLNIEATLEQPSDVTVTVANISGSVISFKNFDQLDRISYQYNTEKLSAGTYFVRIATDHGYKVQKFVVQK